MASSGTYSFDLDIHEVIEEAYELCGLDDVGGYQLKTAKRALDLLLTEWVNKGVNLWTLDLVSTTLTANTVSFTLSSKYVDIVDAAIRDSVPDPDNDTPANRVTLSRYLDFPDKTLTGTPTQYALERNAGDGHTLYIYPVPDVSTFSLLAWTITYPEDSGSYTDSPGTPRRFYPPLVYGLAYNIALKNPPLYQISGEGGSRPARIGGVSREHRMELKANYTQAFQEAAEEDRERASLYLVPDMVGFNG